MKHKYQTRFLAAAVLVVPFLLLAPLLPWHMESLLASTTATLRDEIVIGGFGKPVYTTSNYLNPKGEYGELHFPRTLTVINYSADDCPPDSVWLGPQNGTIAISMTSTSLDQKFVKKGEFSPDGTFYHGERLMSLGFMGRSYVGRRVVPDSNNDPTKDMHYYSAFVWEIPLYLKISQSHGGLVQAGIGRWDSVIFDDPNILGFKLDDVNRIESKTDLCRFNSPQSMIGPPSPMAPMR